MANHIRLRFSVVLLIGASHSKECAQDLLLLGEAEEGHSAGQGQADFSGKDMMVFKSVFHMKLLSNFLPYNSASVKQKKPRSMCKEIYLQVCNNNNK